MSFNPEITVFKDLKQKSGFKIPVSRILERIRTGMISGRLCTQIRGELIKDERTKLKYKLMAIRFCGIFVGQNDVDCISHSGLVCLDFDHTPDPVAKKIEMMALPFVYAAFISPSGDGLKVIVRIPPNIKTHGGFFMGLKAFFNDPHFDSSSQNIARICFESYDPDIYINYEAEEFQQFYYEAHEDATIAIRQVVSDQTELQKVIGVIRRSIPNVNRHTELLKAAKLLGGYLASGVIAESDVIKVENEVREKFHGDSSLPIEIKTLYDGIKEGRMTPIFAQVDESKKDATNNSIIYLGNMWEEIEHEYVHGQKRGETTGFPDLDVHFTWRTGEVTLISGLANSGKSALLHQLRLIRAKLHAKKTIFFSPESYPAKDFYREFMEMYTGKSTDPTRGNVMTKDELGDSYNFMREHIYFVYPKTAHTITEIENNFRYAIEYHGVDTVVIDPYNQLHHNRPSHLREDEYLSEWLTARTRFAEEYDVNYVIVAHPNASIKMVNGDFPVMHYQHLAGGMMWPNKVFNFFVVHRPYMISNKKDMTVEIHVHKIKKQKLVGVPGSVEWTFNRGKQRYFDRSMFNPLEGTSPIFLTPPVEIGTFNPDEQFPF